MKYIKYLLCFCFLYTPFFSNAVELPENNSWSWKHHEKTREQARLKAHLVKQINESGSKKVVEAVVETRPTASKVGGAMMKRITQVAKSPGGAMIGTYAVIQLLEGIGWIMEDGTYVKKIEKPVDPENCDDKNACEYFWNSSVGNDNSNYSTADSACRVFFKANTDSHKDDPSYKYTYQGVSNLEILNYQTRQADCSWIAQYSSNTPNQNKYKIYAYKNPDYIPPTSDIKTVPLTPALLGAAMLGTGYKDPDPNFNNDDVNTDEWTGVPESYTPDPSGVGNELADELEKKADAAPDTPDGKPSGLSDPRYTNDLESNDAANDRSWESGDGTQGSTDSSTSTDHETGETTQTGSFKLPAFCDWAMTVCEWYEGWKKTDTKVNEHIDEEKSFWQTVNDWFDWTKEPLEEEPEQEEPEIDDQGIFNRTFDHVFSLSSECPADIPFELNTEYLSGSFSISLRWLCIIFTVLGYPLVFVSHCIGMWILYETVVRKELKW